MTGCAARTVRAAASAAAATWVARRMLEHLPDPRPWTRVNHRGEPVSLLEGPALAVGLIAGVVAGGPARAATAGAVAVAGAATFGLVDDLSEAGRVRKGLRGHLGALGRGELTTGGLKVLGIGATSLVAGVIALGGRRAAGTGAGRRAADALVAGALIAASANLVNLLDLRPGRALKGGVLLAAPALVGTSAAPAACVGAAAAALGPDLAERDMLGDTGANALGALAGTAAVLAFPPAIQRALLGAAVGLTLASERVSFTEVIDRTPVLRAVDGWGRRPHGEQR
jgi:UDP-N-acetylmuramyl pentapeptide phosphotransferase/UDP-N-acetylglucosamine-1-phosphate transferase